MGLKRSVIAALLLVSPGTAAAQGKVSALLFGDLYYVAAHHDSTLEDDNGLWFRRIYLTYDHNLGYGFSARGRIEAASTGDFSTSENLTTFMKDAWIRWKSGSHAVLIGLQQSPTWSLVEESWGYRHLEKTPADLHRVGSSRDMGVGVTGDFGENGIVGYHLMVGNGAGTKDETGEGKKAMGALRVRPIEHVVVEGYVDYEDRDGSPDRRTFHVYAAYDEDRFRAGAQYINQTRNTLGDDVELNIYSGFAAVRVWSRAASGEGGDGSPARAVWIVARVDRNEDPNPDGGGIAYIPFDDGAASTFFLFGVDFRATPDVSLIPNVEVVSYDEPGNGGVAPDSDVIGRLTFAVEF